MWPYMARRNVLVEGGCLPTPSRGKVTRNVPSSTPRACFSSLPPLDKEVIQPLFSRNAVAVRFEHAARLGKIGLDGHGS